MISKELAKKVNKAVVLWSKNKDKLIVVIDGYTGVGKTTLLNNLANLNPDIIPVNRDDFMFSRETVREKISKAKDKSKIWELKACDNRKLKNFVKTFKNTDKIYKINTYNSVSGKINIPKTFDFSKKIMVIEGVFIFHPKLPFSKLCDKKIYLYGDIQKINRRRIKREKEKWGREYFPENHPDSYVKQIILALERYIDKYHPEKMADLVFKID
jgi:uridine kinase